MCLWCLHDDDRLQISNIPVHDHEKLAWWCAIIQFEFWHAYTCTSLHTIIVPYCNALFRIWTHKSTWLPAPWASFQIRKIAGMPGTFSPPPRVSDTNMLHGTCGTHVPWCMPGSLNTGFLWSQWWRKRSRHSRRMHDPQFYASSQRPLGIFWLDVIKMAL